MQNFLSTFKGKEITSVNTFIKKVMNDRRICGVGGGGGPWGTYFYFFSSRLTHHCQILSKNLNQIIELIQKNC